jgi:hypothetical protein
MATSTLRIKLRAREILGFALAPMVPALLVALPALLQADQRATAYMAFVAKVSYPVILLLGVPAYILTRSKGWTGLPVYVVLGALLGAIAYLVTFTVGPHLGASSRPMYALAVRMLYFPLELTYTAVALILFWLLARPDRQ